MGGGQIQIAGQGGGDCDQGVHTQIGSQLLNDPGKTGHQCFPGNGRYDASDAFLPRNNGAGDVVVEQEGPDDP